MRQPRQEGVVPAHRPLEVRVVVIGSLERRQEAELEKVEVKDHKPQYGLSLGPVGSYIVADTMIGALVADRDSYVWSAGYPAWQPTLEGVSAGEGKSMANLLALVSSADDTEDNCDQP